MTINVLVLCTGNSARSILGEVLINELGGAAVHAFSAGSQPVGRVNAGAIHKLRREGHHTDGLSSKSWDRFSGPEAPRIDIVITVCDNAAGEACPLWNGAPVTVHWGIPDPAADGDFDSAYARLRQRVEAMLRLPLTDMDASELGVELGRIHDVSIRDSEFREFQ
jgi:arsenate reductase